MVLLSGYLVAGTSAEYVPWVWTAERPTVLQTDQPRANRHTAAADDYFHRPLGRALRVDEVISFFGRPDGFSRQYLYNKALGTSELSSKGGTLRFILDEGWEALVWSGDLVHVHMALRYADRDWHLLYK